MPESSSYKSIFKSTFIFSFVKVFQIITGIVKNKIIAILLGPEGVGVIGILSNSISLIQSGTGMGISQSAVRDISEASNSKSIKNFSRVIYLTNKVILFTCLLGIFTTVVLAPFLSKWTFGDKSFTIAYIWISLVVGFNILTEGQLSILKGMRQLRALAKASMIGSFIGLITAIPMYYFFGKSGIVPSLILTAISAVLFSNYYVRKIKYEKIKLTLNEIYEQALPMTKMGLALMLVGFLGLLFELIIAAYIRSKGGLEVVGYYRAGTTIISSYFGIVLTAMTVDYYPRISAIYKDNLKLQEEVNRQSEVGLILIFPVAVLFVFLSPILIKILYSKDFVESIYYTDYAILGTIIVVCSNSMGMIFTAKHEAKILVVYSLIHRAIFIPIYFIFYNLHGLSGLGISYLIDVSVQFTVYCVLNRYFYKIKLKRSLNIQLIITFSIVLTTIFIRKVEMLKIRYLLGAIVFIFSSFYSFYFTKKIMSLNILTFLKNIMKKIK